MHVDLNQKSVKIGVSTKRGNNSILWQTREIHEILLAINFENVNFYLVYETSGQLYMWISVEQMLFAKVYKKGLVQTLKEFYIVTSSVRIVVEFHDGLIKIQWISIKP